jgi:hypothetical protein
MDIKKDIRKDKDGRNEKERYTGKGTDGFKDLDNFANLETCLRKIRRKE